MAKTRNAAVISSLTEYRGKYGWRYRSFMGIGAISSAIALAYAVIKMLGTASKITDRFGTLFVNYTFGRGTWGVSSGGKGWTNWETLTIPGGEISLISPLLILPAAIMLILTMRHLAVTFSKECTEQDTERFMKALSSRISCAGVTGFLMIAASFVGASALYGMLASYRTVGGGIDGIKLSELEPAELVIIGYVMLTVIVSILFAISLSIVCAKMKKILKRDDHGVSSSALRRAEAAANTMSAVLIVMLLLAAVVMAAYGLGMFRIYHGVIPSNVWIDVICPIAVAGMIYTLNKYRSEQSSNFIVFLKKYE